jgi:Holliday junction resolvasome RuvABC endonuclease subunit
MDYKILAVDPATTCGWALSRDVYGTWNLNVLKDESWGMRLIRLEGKLKEIYKTFPSIKVIVYERPGGKHANSMMTQSKIIGTIEKFCAYHEIEYKGYSSGSIKVFSGNKGGCNKKLVIDAAKKKLGYEGNNDNETDALWLLELAKNELKI